MTSASAGVGQTVAVVDAYDDPNAQSDLDVYRSTYDLPPCEGGCFSKVNQEGGSKDPVANASWSIEISLDLDMVSAACPKCHILLVEAGDNTLENLGVAENEAATLGATEISDSYSAREIEIGAAQMKTNSKYYSHAGIPITVASGDDSYKNEQFETEGCGNCSPSYPADLTSVIAVGGTSLASEGSSGRGWSESVWYYSGSGCTLYVTKPAWQTDKGCASRTDNDVAAEASSSTPVSVYDTYQLVTPGWIDIGGTSAATPLVAGAMALESGTLRAEGAEGVYKHTSNWYDVTTGNNWTEMHGECSPNYLCKGQVGYDGPSGIGAPAGGAAGTLPSATTQAASAVTESSGQLNATVDPEAAETTYYFQYGASTLYSSEIPVAGAKVSGYTTPVAVDQALTGLPASTLYHYRVVAKSAEGTTYGADRTFATGPKIYQSKFGLAGVLKGDLNGPQREAVDGYGDVWVSDYANDRVEEFSPTGAVLQTCGAEGSGNGQFKGPTGVAINPQNGSIYVSDSGNDRIEVFSPSCQFEKAFGKAGAEDGLVVRRRLMCLEGVVRSRGQCRQDARGGVRLTWPGGVS